MWRELCEKGVNAGPSTAEEDTLRLRVQREDSQGVFLFPRDPTFTESVKRTINETWGKFEWLTVTIHPAECR
jgi:hypothetical protein